MPTISLEIRRKCKVCGKVFLAKTLDSHHCSDKCRKIAYKRKIDAEKKEKRLVPGERIKNSPIYWENSIPLLKNFPIWKYV